MTSNLDTYKTGKEKEKLEEEVKITEFNENM